MAFALSALAIVLVALVAALPESGVPALPTAVSGSPSPPAEEFDWRSVDPANVLPGRYGNFAADAPDGEAHVLFDFGAPRRFLSLEHVYHRPAPDPWYRVAALRVDTSNDGEHWTTVSNTAVRGGDDLSRMRTDLKEAGAHRWWRVVAAESGAHRLVIFGNLHFAVERPWHQRIPVDVLLMIGAVLVLVIGRATGMRWLQAATLGAAFLLIMGVWIIGFGVSPYWILLGPDSFTYLALTLTGEASSSVTLAYPLFLSLIDASVGLDRLAPLQLSIQVAALLLAAAIISRTRPADALSFLLLAPLLAGALLQFGLAVGTEALFLAGFTVAGAAIGAFTQQASRATAIIAGIALSTAVAVKSVGIVLLVPALLGLRFVPVAWARRYAVLVLLPPLILYVLLCADGWRRFGEFAPQAFGGIALAGHIAWMAHPKEGSQDKLESALEPLRLEHGNPKDAIAASWRARDFTHLDSYVDRSSSMYSAFLVVVDAHVRKHVRNEIGANPPPAAVNEAMMSASMQWIRADPLAYAAHVAAHFYGLWRDAGTGGYLARNPATPLPDPVDTAWQVRANVPLLDSWLHPQALQLIRNRISPRPDAHRSAEAAVRQSMLPLTGWLNDLWPPSALTSRTTTTALGVLALLVSSMLLMPARIATPWSAQIVTALMLNAYFLGHAMFQVTLVRYAHTAAPLMLLLAIGTTSTAVRLLVIAREKYGDAENGTKSRSAT